MLAYHSTTSNLSDRKEDNCLLITMKVRRNGQRAQRQGLFLWMFLICVLVGKVCQAQFQIQDIQTSGKHSVHTGNSNEAFGMKFIAGGGDTPTISEKAGDTLLQPSVLSSAELPPSPQSQIPVNRIQDRKRHERFRPRRTQLTPPPSSEFKKGALDSSPLRTRPPKGLLSSYPSNSPATGCASSDDGSIGDTTWREEDIIIQYSYEISLSENTEDMSEILMSIKHHVMDIVMTLVARCDTVSGIWQLQPEEEINGQLQQNRRQLQVVGISTSNAKLLDGLCMGDLDPDAEVCKVVGGEVRLHVSNATEDNAANVNEILVAIDDGVVRLVDTNPQILQPILLYARVEAGTTKRPTTISPA
eukprot:scaffold12791_cov48-Attheya_sp.AAC.1